MEWFIILLFLFVILPIAVVVHSVRYAREWRSVFRKPILEERAQFWQDTFGLTADELRQFHFDGYAFHLRGQHPYAQFSSISCVGQTEVRIVNPDLPHSTTWQHTRVDGRPDRRYSSNAQIMSSRRFTMRLDGEHARHLTAYTLPYGSIDSSIHKFNLLFDASVFVDLESCFARHSCAFEKRQRHTAMLDRTRAKRAKKEAARNAVSQLPSGGSRESSEIAAARKALSAELRVIDSEIAKLQRQIETTNIEMQEVAESVRREVDNYRSLLSLLPHIDGVIEDTNAAKRARLAALYLRASKALRRKQWESAIDLLNTVMLIEPDYRDSSAKLTRAEKARTSRRRLVYAVIAAILTLLLGAVLAASLLGRQDVSANPSTPVETALLQTPLLPTPLESYSTTTYLPSATFSPPPTPTATVEPTASPTLAPIPGSSGADLVLAYNPGFGLALEYGDAEESLGEPDAVESPCCQGMVQLGRGGSLLLAFIDNVIVDSNGLDFRVYGESAGDDYILIEVSGDGKTWRAYPKMPEAAGGLDLADLGLAEAVYVRLTDVQPGTATGAEIDAVVALHSGAGLGSRLPDLPDAVAREDLTLREGPNSQTREVGEVDAGLPIAVLGREESSRWVKVRADGGKTGWLPTEGLGLNITLKEYWVIPIPTTEVVPVATSKPTARPLPTPTTKPDWILVADSRSDYPGIIGERKWWYLWSSGTNNFYWQDMMWDDPNWCYKSSNDWDLRICQDRIQTDARGDVALQWKAAQGGTYRFEWDSAALSFYVHASQAGSQGPGSELAYSATIRDVIDWELFYWVARGHTSYHVKVYRLQE